MVVTAHWSALPAAGLGPSLSSWFSLPTFSCTETSSFFHAAAAAAALFAFIYLASRPHFLLKSLLPHEGREAWWHSLTGATAEEEENRGKEIFQC